MIKKTARNGSSDRLLWIDFLRGGGILLVVLGHTFRDQMINTYAIIDFIYQFIYSFHMDIFFFLSGITYVLFARGKDMGNFFASKLKSLILPWISYSILVYLVYWIGSKISFVNHALFDEDSICSISSYVIQTVRGDNPYAFHVWFVLILFLIQIIMYFVDRIVVKCKRQGWILFGILVISLFFSFCFTTDLHVVAWTKNRLPIYVLGMIVALKGESIRAILSRFKWVLLVIGGGVLLVYSYFQMMDNLIYGQVTIYRIRVLIGLPCFLTALYLILYNSNTYTGFIKGFFLKIGMNSFNIYLLHQPFCCASPTGKRDAAFIIIASELGMRSKDICNLKLSDIDWEASSADNLIQR